MCFMWVWIYKWNVYEYNSGFYDYKFKFASTEVEKH